ncbi:MAG: hypothetical protein RIC30_12495 [Marinoscillum sp.]|uniref:hypothetical protein n=1 Tax=Marinoscillum sp. TaxID=2024838 RepID=UPI00330293AC
MKEIQYLSIQGSCAPSFWFKDHDAQSFRSLIESLTLSHSLIISSIYRTDVFFMAEEDHLDLIIRSWSTLKRHSFDQHLKGKFIRANNRKEAFELYFDTLFHLIKHPKHHERYRIRLNEIQQLESNNPILKELMECDMLLTEKYREQHVKYVSLATAEQIGQYIPSCENFSLLAHERLRKLNYN